MSARPRFPMIRAAVLWGVLAAAAFPVAAQHQHAGREGMPGMDAPAPPASASAPASSMMDGMAMSAPATSSPSAPMPMSMPMPMPMHGDTAPAAPGGHQDMHHGTGRATRQATHEAMDRPTVSDMPAPAATSASVPMHGDVPPAAPQGHPPMHRGMGRDKSSGAQPGTVAGMSNGSDAAHPAADAMAMGRMQGGPPPADARSPDYSEGAAPSLLPGMDMGEVATFALLQVDQLESFAGRDEHGQRWELHGWYGNDDDKLLVRSEGERSGGRIAEGDVEALWSHAVAAYWDTTLGMRHDLGDGPRRDWLAVGVRGLAPYWFEVEATGYVGRSGRTAARLRADYDVLFTQRLILQPELEANLYGRDDPAHSVGRGLSDVQGGVRLRYEIRRELAPYVGVQFVRRLGRTADFARAAGQPVSDRRFVVGLRLWF